MNILAIIGLFSKYPSFFSKITELMYKAQEIISRDVPYIFLYSPNNLLAVNRKIKGINPNPINIFDNISEWRLE
jgi:ABC-type transport system substrate-binding protein